MNKQELFRQMQKKQSFLCVGLDADLTKIPPHLLSEEDPIFAFNRQIIESTANYCIAYKPNIAFYESLGIKGWQSLQKTLDYIPDECFTIADAKRGDIGNTAKMYAKTFFETFTFDAITVTPYMGADSVKPFLAFENKWAILLVLTSNPGSRDFQRIHDKNNKPLFEQVLEKSMQWADADKMMYVVGATQAESLERIRVIAPDRFLLIPGIGVQGGSLAEVVKYGLNKEGGLLVNASRSIIYADNTKYFGKASLQAARKIQEQMASALEMALI